MASPVTATTDFLAPDILDKSGRAVPAPWGLSHSTLATILAEGPQFCEGWSSFDGRRLPSRITSSPDAVRAINDGMFAPLGATADMGWKRRNLTEAVIGSQD